MLYDLLSSVPGTPENLQIVEEGGATVVKGLTQVQVATQEEALALLFEGNMALQWLMCSSYVCVLMSCRPVEEKVCTLLLDKYHIQDCKTISS